MTTYHVQRSIIIKTTQQKINTLLRDYKSWHKWSPWLIMEKDASLVYSKNQGQIGSTYAWSGILVGTGSMELLKIEDSILSMQINFLQPFKSQAMVRFDLKKVEEGIEVSWTIEGKFPWFMFWIRKSMQAYIGMDYERGLRMLKEYTETGSVASYVIIEGILPIKPQRYIGIPRKSNIEELGETMHNDFITLDTFIKAHNITPTGLPFSIYQQFDVVKKESEYMSCIPIDSDIEIDKSWVKGKLDTVNALTTLHRGRYEHMGNAWMTAINFSRIKKLKMQKRPLGYEFYLNSPIDTAHENLITKVMMPIRS